jgi:hypothetical protein
MGLVETIDSVERQRKTLTVYAPTERSDLERGLATRNVAVEYEPLPDVGQGFVVVADEDGFQGALTLRAFERLLEPPLRRPGKPHPDEEFRFVFDVLDDTVFSSLDRRQLLATSREIEDRAWRVGRGELHVGFQSLSVMRTQLSLYRHFGTETDVDVHVYGRPDWEPPSLQGVTVHTPDEEEIGRVWFLVFDGGDADNETVLLAEQRTADTYAGFWSYDPALVDGILGYLWSTYGSPDSS